MQARSYSSRTIPASKMQTTASMQLSRAAAACQRVLQQTRPGLADSACTLGGGRAVGSALDDHCAMYAPALLVITICHIERR